MRRLVPVFLAALLGAWVADAHAGANPEAKIALDCQPRTIGRHCTPTYESEEELQQYLNVSGYYDVIVVLYDFHEVRGIEYGLDYSGVEDWYFTGFVSCAEFNIGGVDLGGWTSVVQVWDRCISLEDLPSGQTALGLGWLLLYGGVGPVSVVSSDTGHLQVLDCSSELDPIVGMRMGFLGGYEPPLAAQSSTWGALKALYR